MLSERLKSDTQAHHHAAEASPAMQAVMDDRLTRGAYRDHLARLLAFYRATEAALAETPGLADLVPDLDARLVKSQWLRDDLARLGAGPAAPRADVPRFSLAQALGTLYVVEGSTLGGRLIARQLSRSVGVGPEDGARFYHSYGDARGERWTGFKAALDAWGQAHPDKADEAIQAAADAFDAFRAWMALPLAPDAASSEEGR